MMPALAIRSSSIPFRKMIEDTSSYRSYSYKKSNNKLVWDNEASVFQVNAYRFSLDELFYFYKKLLNKQVEAPFSIIPVFIKELDYERLTCYDEDKR